MSRLGRHKLGLVRFGLALGGPFWLALVPGFGPNNYTYSLLNFGLIYSLVALGLTLLTGYAGQISLGHSGLLAVGAYTCAGLTARWAWPLWLSLPVAAALTGLVGFGLGLPALRLNGPYLAVVTVGFTVAVPQFLKFLDFRTDGIEGLKIAPLNWLGFGPDDDLARYYLLLPMVGVAYWLTANLTNSGVGRAWLALRANPTAAQASGINLARYKVLAFVLSAVLTGLAGGLYVGQLGRIEAEQFNLLQSIQFVVMITVGGLGSVDGAIAGAILLTLTPEIVSRLSNLAQDGLNGLGLAVQLKNPQYVLYGLLLLGFVRFGPHGLAGWWRKFRPIRPPAPVEPVPLVPVTAAPLFRLEGVTVRFGGLTALDDFSLEVRPGEIIGLIGPNGAGKTTAFNAISRFVPLDSGRIWWGDHDLTREAASTLAGLGIARTFQNGGLFEELSVMDNLLIGQHSRLPQTLASSVWSRRVSRQSELTARRQAQGVLNRLGIGATFATRVADLPFGTQRLVELARALVGGPSLLLLDEPAAGLNGAETSRLIEIIRGVRDETGLSVLVVEHDMRLVMSLCDRLYVLNFGKTLATGQPTEVRSDPAVVTAYLGES